MSYTKIKVYKEACALELLVWELTKKIPSRDAGYLTDQIRRASQSIRANIAEGYGRNCNKKEFLRFLRISLASCDELTSHLKQIALMFPNFKIENEIDQSIKTGKMLNAFIQGVIKYHK